MTERGPGVWRLRVMTDKGQVERQFRGSRPAAAKELARLCTDAKAGKLVSINRTVEQLLDEWLIQLGSLGRAPKTLQENKREIETRIKPAIGNLRLARLTPRHLDELYGKWLREGLSPSSVRRHAAVMSSALSQAVKWGWIESSPALRATPPAQRLGRTIVTPTPAQVADLIRAAQDSDPVLALAIALAFVTGGRRGELAAIRWSDIDLSAPSLRISRSITDVDGRLMVKGTKTDRSRTIALDTRAAGLIDRHFNWQRRLSEAAQSPLVDDPFLLSDNADGGRPVAPDRITERFSRIRGQVGMKAVRFHDLRHSSITHLIGSGIDISTVSARAGHASTKMTLDRYSHAMPAGDIAAAEAIGALLPTYTDL